jgi:hypothetical protein
MQAFGRRSADGLMAAPAHRFGIGEGRVPDHIPVGRLPVRVVGVAPMTVLARNLSVIALQKRGVDVQLFIQLQRSQGAASAFAGGFSGSDRRHMQFFHLPG